MLIILRRERASFAGWMPHIQNNGDSIVLQFGVRERGATIGEAGNKIGKVIGGHLCRTLYS